MKTDIRQPVLADPKPQTLNNLGRNVGHLFGNRHQAKKRAMLHQGSALALLLLCYAGFTGVGFRVEGFRGLGFRGVGV